MTNAWKRLLPPSAPALLEVPGALLRAVLFGVITGPPLGLVFEWFGGHSLAPLWRDPAPWLMRAMFIAVTYTLSFYVLCGLIVSYVARQLFSMRVRYATWILALLGFSSGMLAYLAAVFVISGRAPGPNVQRMAVAEGILCLVLTLTISAWRRAQIEKDLAEAKARSHVLRAQINPHFFFNTLNTISAQIPVDPAAAQQTIGLLAEMTRHAFATADLELVPLSRELEFAKAYLDIEKVRFGERLNADLPDPATLEGLSIPGLTVQPLIENAVRYGIAKRIEGGYVAVSAHRNGPRFSLTIENDRDASEPLSISTFFQPGHAVANIRERLRLIYKDAAAIEVTFPTPQSVVVSLQIPVAS